tara:strand:+ start:186 stop:548 length:363 start_codon:yes stop_codon:yes gene_type:complete
MNKKWIKTKRATRWKEGENFIELWYHKTPVVRVETTEHGDIITLNTGGYKTVTTKARINDFFRYSSEHDVGVYQKDYEWYVVIDGIERYQMTYHTYVIDMRVLPENTDESTHEEITKTMN